MQGTSPRWTLIIVEKADTTAGVLVRRPFSASRSGEAGVSVRPRVPLPSKLRLALKRYSMFFQSEKGEEAAVTLFFKKTPSISIQLGTGGGGCLTRI